MRAASYIRVSTAQQATEDKVSLEEQQVNIETYCGSKGYRIVERYRDVGSGASKRRPDFQRMLKDAQEGRFDVIVAWKSDRLSRGLYPAAALMEALEGSQIGVEAVRDSVDVNTFSLLAAVGKIELENIRERARMGSRGRAARGKLWGVLKFGYHLGEQGEPLITPAEAEVVSRVFTEYVQGHNPMSIAGGLNADRLLTRGGNPWTNAEIWRIIRESTYKGQGYFNRRSFFKRDNGQREVRHRRMRPRDEWVEVAFPPIVDDATWDQAQEIRRRNARINARTGANLKFPLRGLVWCGSCGGRFVSHGRSSNLKRYRRKDGTVSEKRVNYPSRRYRCLKSTRKLTDCPKRSVSAIRLESAVWSKIEELLSSKSAMRALIEARKEDSGGQASEVAIERARSRLRAAEKERENRLSQHAKGYINDSELDAALRSLQDQISMHQDELGRLEREFQDRGKYLHHLQNLEWTADYLSTKLSNLNEDERTEALQTLINRIVVDSEEVQLVLAVGQVIQAGAPASSA